MNRRMFFAAAGAALMGGPVAVRADIRPSCAWSGWIPRRDQAALVGHWIAALPNGYNAIATTLGHVGVYRPFECIDLLCRKGWGEITAATPPRQKDAVQERARQLLANFLRYGTSFDAAGEYEFAHGGWSHCLDVRDANHAKA